MNFKVVVVNADGDEVLSLITSRTEVVRTIMRQFDKNGAQVILDLHLEGPEVYKVLYSGALRDIERNTPPAPRPPIQALMEDVVTRNTPHLVSPMTSMPRAASTPVEDTYSMGVKDIECTSCHGTFTLQEEERYQRFVTCPHCDEMLDSEKYPKQGMA